MCVVKFKNLWKLSKFRFKRIQVIWLRFVYKPTAASQTTNFTARNKSSGFLGHVAGFMLEIIRFKQLCISEIISITSRRERENNNEILA